MLFVALKKFWAASEGSILPMFVISAIPLIALIGMAVDYSRANTVRSKLQGALDSTALAMSANAGTVSAADLQKSAQAYFDALFTKYNSTPVSLNVSYSTTGGAQITVSGTTDVKTTFLRVPVYGVDKLTVGASSTVAWGNTRLRVALVLDNTGSMSSSNKMSALKTATKSLLSQLKTAATTPEDVYVSIIPFSKDDNVGASNYTASWIDWTDWNERNGTCRNYRYWPYYGSPTIYSDCINYRGTWTTDSHSTWNGCVMDRGDSIAPSMQNYDQNITAPTAGTQATLFAAEQYGYCTLQIMGLSNNWTAMNSLVDNMIPNGATNQPIGLVWGWMSLAGVTPMSAPTKDSKYQYKEVVILLSDGLNTQDRWYGNGSSVSASVDSRMYNSSNGSGTCKNIKDAGITIYTVQVNTDGDPTSTLLKNCASDASKFFLLTSATQIVTVFNQIGTTLSQLRVAK